MSELVKQIARLLKLLQRSITRLTPNLLKCCIGLITLYISSYTPTYYSHRQYKFFGLFLFFLLAEDRRYEATTVTVVIVMQLQVFLDIFK